MFCGYCGKQLPDDSAFCTACGKKLTGTVPQPPVQQPPVQQPPVQQPPVQQPPVQQPPVQQPPVQQPPVQQPPVVKQPAPQNVGHRGAPVDNRNPAGKLPAEWEQQEEKAFLRKKYLWIMIGLICVIVLAVLLLLLTSFRCSVFGHQWQAATCTTPKTCSHCEQIQGRSPGHDWIAATCDTPQTCAACNETYGDVLTHQWNQATCLAPKTCLLCGRQEGSVLDHSWEPATCQKPRSCATCGQTEGAALGHNWNQATCTNPKTCATCGQTEGTALGHNWMDATKERPATCATCGTVTGNRILPILTVTNLSWGGEGSPQYNCDDTVATLAFPQWSSFPSASIVIEDSYDQQMPAYAFEFEWNNGAFRITPYGHLECGVYHITFSCQEGTATYSLCYGYEGEIYLEYPNIAWYNYAFRNWKNGRYLAKTEYGLVTTTSSAEKLFFSWNDKLCGIVEVAGWHAYPSNDLTFVQFVTSAYVRQGDSDLYVFTHNGWHMASDSGGNIYFSRELTDECYWSDAE